MCDYGADPDHVCRRCDEAVCFPPGCPLEYTVG
jgi:hypothetical protein